MPFTETLDADDETFGDTIQDTLNLTDTAQLREDAKFHEMTRLVKISCRDTGLLSQRFKYFKQMKIIVVCTQLKQLRKKQA